ncbi:hypothetical protein CDAR_191651 [Caerostris darwini]|uniref:Uncharacterized protein n=1 Tax=Caerostris darwini TaxID=1538125 RepID=A0AAV4W7A8_9ARAC|nr:hypothetical protein CDAR_191651 [Caerostris darwini]
MVLLTSLDPEFLPELGKGEKNVVRERNVINAVIDLSRKSGTGTQQKIDLQHKICRLTGPLSLDPNSSLQESSSGGLPCSADSAAGRQTDLGYSGTVWNK